MNHRFNANLTQVKRTDFEGISEPIETTIA